MIRFSLDILNCDRTNEDPNILYPTELKKNNLSGVICHPKSARGTMRLGYMRHWGVARDDGDYYRQWVKTLGKICEKQCNFHSSLFTSPAPLLI